MKPKNKKEVFVAQPEWKSLGKLASDIVRHVSEQRDTKDKD